MTPIDNQRLYDLYDRFVDNSISAEELGEFFELLKEPANTVLLEPRMDHRWDRLFENSESMEFSQAVGLSDATALGEAVRSSAMARVIPLHRRPAFRIAAAIILLFAGSLWLIVGTRKAPEKRLTIASAQDLAPGTNKATLILGNGRQVILDSTGKGEIALQGGAAVTKIDDGQLAYSPQTYNSKKGGEKSSEKYDLVYNTLRTPRGGQYQLRLPDGTRVWLDAASTITFPTAFTGDSRRVTVTGEVYMEVAKDLEHPFFVSVGRDHSGGREQGAPPAADGKTGSTAMEVRVLGTSFNVDAYDDEPAIRTTLLEGAVATSVANTSRILHPGQQAVLPAGQEMIKVISGVDPDDVLAWKNGLFRFDNADIRTVMRQLARWYDVEITFEGEPTKERFQGKMPRDANASQVLKVLEKNNVHFRIEGKTIVVLP